jgi:hypothetical protein
VRGQEKSPTSGQYVFQGARFLLSILMAAQMARSRHKTHTRSLNTSQVERALTRKHLSGVAQGKEASGSL